MILTARTALAGVLGWPVEHSRSPRLHGFWLRRHGIDGSYMPLPVTEENFDSAVCSLVDLGFRGANVTLPHKERAFRLADEVTKRAARMKAVNTLIFKDGQIIGDNTDGFGFIENLRQQAPQWNSAAGPVTILGAGGAARGLIVALQDAGVGKIRLLNRTRSRAEALAKDIGGMIEVVDWPAEASVLQDTALLVNSTTLGMSGQPPLELDLDFLPETAIVADIVYSPLCTELLKKAEKRGLTKVEGLGMLLHQARPGFEAWFGVSPVVDQELEDFVMGGA